MQTSKKVDPNKNNYYYRKFNDLHLFKMQYFLLKMHHIISSAIDFSQDQYLVATAACPW
jgi:hypothetical protein